MHHTIAELTAHILSQHKEIHSLIHEHRNKMFNLYCLRTYWSIFEIFHGCFSLNLNWPTETISSRAIWINHSMRSTVKYWTSVSWQAKKHKFHYFTWDHKVAWLTWVYQFSSFPATWMHFLKMWKGNSDKQQDSSCTKTVDISGCTTLRCNIFHAFKNSTWMQFPAFPYLLLLHFWPLLDILDTNLLTFQEKSMFKLF